MSARSRDRRRARLEHPRHDRNLIERNKKGQIRARIQPLNCPSYVILEPSRKKGEGLAALRSLSE